MRRPRVAAAFALVSLGWWGAALAARLHAGLDLVAAAHGACYEPVWLPAALLAALAWSSPSTPQRDRRE